MSYRVCHPDGSVTVMTETRDGWQWGVRRDRAGRFLAEWTVCPAFRLITQENP